MMLSRSIWFVNFWGVHYRDLYMVSIMIKMQNIIRHTVGENRVPHRVQFILLKLYKDNIIYDAIICKQVGMQQFLPALLTYHIACQALLPYTV